jgi:hypothetical protein
MGFTDARSALYFSLSAKMFLILRAMNIAHASPDMER